MPGLADKGPLSLSNSGPGPLSVSWGEGLQSPLAWVWLPGSVLHTPLGPPLFAAELTPRMSSLIGAQPARWHALDGGSVGTARLRLREKYDTGTGKWEPGCHTGLHALTYGFKPFTDLSLNGEVREGRYHYKLNIYVCDICPLFVMI